MPPKPLSIDWDEVMKSAREVAASEAMPSRTKLANRLGFVASTLNKRAAEAGKLEAIDAILQGGREIAAKDNEGAFSSAANDPTPAPWKAEDVIRAHGDDPDECVILRQRGNRWGDPGEPMHQLRVDWVRKAELIQPADPKDWSAPPKPKKRKREKYLDAVVISDHHAPHHEPTFHRLFLDYLRDAQPGLIEVNGDLLDFSTISRHREREAYAQPVNECIQAGFGILRDYREVCPDATIRYKRGNHEERLLHLILDNAKGLHNITPAHDEVPALSLRRLLHLDELHIDYVDAEWDQAKTKLSRKLTARHGFSTSKGAGNAMLDKLAGSTVQGHDHRIGITVRTEHPADEDDPLRVRMGVQGGCACTIPGGLGYINGGQPDWANGCTAFRIWPDGDFHASLGVYVKGRFLAPNGQRYSA